MQDETTLLTEIPERVQPFDVVVRGPQTIERNLAHASHDAHTDGNIRTISNFHANLTIRGAHRPHDVGHHVHCAALHGTGKKLSDLGFGFGWGHPIIVRSGILTLPRADIGEVLGPCHVRGVTAV